MAHLSPGNRNLKALGVDDLTIQRIMRHTDVDTTRRAYIKVRDAAVENAMRALESACKPLYSQMASGIGKLMKTLVGPVAQMDRAAVS
jgi:hypothetical protein